MSEWRPEEREAFRSFAAWKHRPKVAALDVSDGPSPQQVYADLMKTVFAPALRKAGLRGSGGRFEIPSERYWAQLGFQKSAYSDGQEIRFTVNLSVIPRDVWTEQAAAKPYLGKQPTPTYHYGSWAEQTRIGKLTPGGEDQWWRIVRGLRAEGVADDVLQDLLGLAVPWLRARTVEREVDPADP